MTQNGSVRARFGPFEVDLHTHELWKFGTRLKLVGQPFEILAVLLSKSGELVTREELHSRLWPADTFVDFNHGLNAAVNKLREALSDSADAPRYVETLPRRGYRFIAAIEWVNAEPVRVEENIPAMPPPVVIRAETPPRPQPILPPDGRTKRTVRRWPAYVVGTLILLTLIMGVRLLVRTVSGLGAGLATRPSVERTRLLTSVADTSSPAFSPDGNSVAFFHQGPNAGDEGIFITVVGSDQPVQLTGNRGDCCPVWSPDGRSIAFTRFVDKQYALYVVSSDAGTEQKIKAERAANPQSAAYSPVAGSAEHKLDTNGVIPQHGELDWSPDGKSIAFASGTGIYLLSLSDSSVRRMTQPPPLSQDWGPEFSPDGQRILFVRNRDVGSPDEIWSVPLTEGGAVQILSERGRISSPPHWLSDGRTIIYSSNRNGHPALWRASLDAPEATTQISDISAPAWDPAVSRRGYRLAYERLMRSLSIWQMDVSVSGEKSPHIIVSSTSDTDQGPAPQFSPDGEKLAYMSDRSGTMEIWVSNRDGGNPVQLTAVGGAGTPRWSPDSQSIVFDARATNGPKIVSISLKGGAPQILTPDSFENECPSWSRDGRWVYFASSRSGDRQVWKVPAAGGTPVQVTHQGGHAALDSPDGKILFYAKNAMAEPEIWQVPVEGGPETPLPLVRPGTWASWQVVETGILFVGPSLGHQAVLSFYDFASRRTTTVAVLNRVPFWLGASPDGRTVAFDQPGQEQAQAMLVENFR